MDVFLSSCYDIVYTRSLPSGFPVTHTQSNCYIRTPPNEHSAQANTFLQCDSGLCQCHRQIFIRAHVPLGTTITNLGLIII